MEEVVARRIKAIRLENGMSQIDLADKCNVSKSLICKIEANKAAIKLELLYDIAKAFNVSIFELFGQYQDKKDRAIVVKKNERKKLAPGGPVDKSYAYYQMASCQKITAHILRISKDALTTPLVSIHNGEELFYIMEGKIKFYLADEEYLLNEGDTACFKANVEHKIVPFECDSACLIMVYIP